MGFPPHDKKAPLSLRKGGLGRGGCGGGNQGGKHGVLQLFPVDQGDLILGKLGPQNYRRHGQKNREKVFLPVKGPARSGQRRKVWVGKKESGII